MLRFTLCLFLTFIASEALATRVVVGNETWSGRVELKGALTIPAGATLTLTPGAELRFSPGAGMFVEGRLVASGSTKTPILFLPAAPEAAPGSWQGLFFTQGTKEGSSLSYVKITGANRALSITGSKVRVVSSVLTGGAKGIESGGGSLLTLENVTVREMSEVAIDANVGSQGSIVGCRIEKVQGAGIQLGKKTDISIRDNHISSAKIGIFATGDVPPVIGNTLQKCEAGIVILQASAKTIVRGNRIADAQVGIACHQFSSPIIEGNVIERCTKGIDCFQMSSPVIRQNRLENNRMALSAVQMCNALVTRNDFLNNTSAVYLHLSSYSQLHENNFDKNAMNIELDNMSYDWEVRAKKKPARSYQVQSENQMQRTNAATAGRMTDAEDSGGIKSEGFVNAKENYWGEKTTQELVAKGTNGNLTTIQDALDVPTRTYEGWPGAYRQDRVRVDGWKKERIKATGPQ